MKTTLQVLEAQLELGLDIRPRVDTLNELAWELLNADVLRAHHYAEQARVLAAEEAYERGHARALNMQAACSYRLSRYADAIEISEKALEESRRADEQSEAAFALNTIGATAIRLADYGRALESFLASLEMRERMGDQGDIATSLMNIGNVYQALGDNARALDYYLRSLGIRKTLGDSARIGTSLTNIGIIYAEIGEHEQALEYLHDSLRLKEESANRQGMMTTINRLAEVYLATGDTENALLYARQNLDLAKGESNTYAEATAYYNIGRIMEAQGRREEASEHFGKSLELTRAIGNRSGEAKALCSIGTLLLARGQVDEAIRHFVGSRQIAEETESRKLLYESARALAESHATRGDFEQAYRFFSEFYRVKEETISAEVKKRARDVQVLRQVEQSRQAADIYRQRMEELADLNHALRELNEEKNEFLGIVAHDLKNPLTGIIMVADLMEARTEYFGKTEIKERAGTIKSAAQRMETIISSLLDIHAIESGTIELSKERFDLAQLADQLSADYREMAARKNIRLLSRSGQRGLYVSADKDKTYQVLDNLVSNALKFSPPDTVVQIDIAPTEKGYCCRVRDQGPGITHEDQERLFTKYARLSARPTGGEHSTGLGLSIAKRLVEQMGGRIWCESHPGRGSEFAVELPQK